MFKQWQLKDFDVGGGLAAGAAQGGESAGWIAVSVPGDTHQALIDAGRLADPFLGRNETAANWVAEREWWWRTAFDAAPAQAGERVELVFEGLDTFATIHLNGQELARTDNMFRSWRFDVGALLRANGTNELAIAFAPATASVAGTPPLLWGAMGEKLTASRRNQIRKAQFGWGWDWGPNLPTVGVWQPVRLERTRQARIEGLRFSTQRIGAQQAEVRVDIEVERIASISGLQLDIAIRDPAGATVASGNATLSSASTGFDLHIANPQLWWTADLGAQPLYTVEARLLDAGNVLDTQQRRVGLRTLVLDTSPDADEPGTEFFRFVLNGVPIFARGACWIPESSFVGAISAGRYRERLELAVRANMNMLRVWGGGIYEPDCFYEACDELGLLVWQDFMFACAPYADTDAAFVASVQAELRDQVRRLRHHPCLALWCGNNENQAIQSLINALTGTQAALVGQRFYDEIIPAVLKDLDPVTPYWPGSPSGGPNPNSMRAGDVHDWTVWHGVPPVPDDQFVGGYDRSEVGVAYTRYAEDMGRFISEFGIHAAPAMSTLRRWLDADDLRLDAEGFIARNKDEPKDKIYPLMRPLTGEPATLAQYVDFTQMTQAEGLKFGIEHFRRRKPHCSGTLIWQYNDCWPCVSWSLVDYDGVGKAGYYAVKRVYAPVMASFKRLDGDAVELWITNDTLQPISGVANIELLRFAGGAEWQHSQPYTVAANGSVAVWRGTAPVQSTDSLLCVHSVDGAFADNRVLLAPVKDLALVAGAAPRARIEQAGPQELRVHLDSEHYLLAVQLESERPGLRYSDNHFDLRPGAGRTITVRSGDGALSPGDVQLRCWNQQRR